MLFQNTKMTSNETIVLPITNYECHVLLKKKRQSIWIDRRLVVYPTAFIVFVLLSWGIGTLIFVTNGTCSTCLDRNHILMAMCSGAIVLLIAWWVLMCCGTFVVAGLQLGTSSSGYEA